MVPPSCSRGILSSLRLPFISIAMLLAVAARAEAGRFFIQWSDLDARNPWLKEVSVSVHTGNATVKSKPLPRGMDEYPNGLEVAFEIGGDAAEPVWFRVKLAGDYGFTVSPAMLRDHSYLWVKAMGLYLSRDGWAATAAARADTDRLIAESRAKPFVSTAERYTHWTGLTGHEPDDLHRFAWDFVNAKESWPAEAKVIDRIAAMPEIDAAYFFDRVPDLTRTKMFLGWPNHNDQFTLWSHGRVTVSSQSVGGDPKVKDLVWHPRARDYSFQYSIGAAALPRLREYGDPGVSQRLADGYNLIPVSQWEDDGFRLEQTCFALPQSTAPVRTGLEPLLLWTRLDVANTAASARDAWLGLEFNDQAFVTFVTASPLPEVGKITWRDGAFYAGDKVLAVADPALVFERQPAHGAVSRFRARVPLAAGEKRSFAVAHFYRVSDGASRPVVNVAEFESARRRFTGHWDGIAAAGASIRVPEEWLNNLYRTFLPRIMINAHLDPTGQVVVHTGPIQYARVWHHITSLGVGGDLARRGQFELCRRYMEAFFRWQGIPAPDSPAITDWTGFFGAPPEQCPKVWISYQGMVLWAAARYYQLSGDRQWLDAHLPALIQGMEWIVRNRRVTMKLEADGSKPINYGWLPPGRVGDSGKGDMNGIYSDASAWRGMDELAGVLRDIGHPRAAEFQTEADDHRRCIVDSERRSSAMRPLVRLNDSTWVPYLPAALQTTGGERDAKAKYANVVDAAWGWGILDTGVFGRGAPEARWLLDVWEDDYALLVPALSDEPFTTGPMAEYLAADQVENYLYAFYSQSANTLDRETLTTFEHRSWGQKRAFELTPWAAGYWTANFTNLLCRTFGDELWLLQATPRRWLENGKEISVEKLQTEFGPVSFRVRSKLASGTIEAEVQPPSREPAKKLRLRLRVPAGRVLRAVTVNGQAWKDFDPTGGWIALPAGKETLKIEADY
jgi:hypothetical protein